MSDEVNNNELPNNAADSGGVEKPLKPADELPKQAETKANSSATTQPNPADSRPAYNFETDLRNLALNGLLKGIGSVISFVNEVAERIEERAEQTREQASQTTEKQAEVDLNINGTSARFGYSIRSSLDRIDAALAGRPPAATSATRSGFPPPAARLNPMTSPDVLPIREPMLDIFDEAAENIIIVVVELPGVAENDIVVEIQDDILCLKASGKTYRYEKESLLPAMVETTPVSRHYQNGMLELRLKRIIPPTAPESETDND